MGQSNVISTLVFDWGDTLMRTIPGYTGPMIDWPTITVVEGILPSLEQLSGRYKLAVATNAADSPAAQVKAALDRGGLGKYFQAVFTTHELQGLRKPDVTYFHAIETALGEPAHHLLMIGDDYQVDILGARRAGWRTAWFNPGVRPCVTLTPRQDIDIYRMSDLPTALTGLRFPGWDTCQVWMLARSFPYSLWLHSQTVAAIAYLLAVWLRQNGESVDPILTHRGGLLHDLAKLPPFPPGILPDNHGEMAARLLTTSGQPELAEIARRHMLFSLIEPEITPQTWEQKLVYFADKLVEGSTLVNFVERLNSLRLRYPMEDQARSIDAITPALETLQSEICQAIHLPPENLIPTLRDILNKGR